MSNAGEPIADTPQAEKKSTSDILLRAGISDLTEQSGIDAVETALRRLCREMTGVDRLREATVRSEAIKHLQNIGI